jgi:hypothetical protein
MSEKIVGALRQLDAGNDNHWTEDGLPRLDTVKLMAGDQKITREQCTAAAPGFSRATPTINSPSVAPVPRASDAKARVGDETDAETQEGDGGTLAGVLAASVERLRAASERKAQADQDYTKAQQENDAVLDAMIKNGKRETLTDHIKAYHARTAELREERRVKMERTRELDLSQIIPRRAPVDEAMRRKTQRGGTRPVTLVNRQREG